MRLNAMRGAPVTTAPAQNRPSLHALEDTLPRLLGQTVLLAGRYGRAASVVPAVPRSRPGESQRPRGTGSRGVRIKASNVAIQAFVMSAQSCSNAGGHCG